METEELDSRVCSRARLARDARFDGKFFIAVRSTRVYCRPICRSRSSRESGVRYFQTAAAAEEAGFRPCLRCRPECSPGSPVWAGTQNTVTRALRLINEDSLENGGVEGLAERVGVGARHLRRLFMRHLGTTPSGVARTNRLHFAKKLIDETRMPMTQVAIAAGFGCVRRFNATIRKRYKRTPMQIRRLAHQTRGMAVDEYIFNLHFRAPYDWQSMLNFLEARAISGVEMVDGGIYRRSISLSGSFGYFEVSFNESKSALSARLEMEDPRLLFPAIERIRGMFDVNADCAIVARTLKNDPMLAKQVEKWPGLRVPGCWDGFELTIWAILAEEATVAAATALAGRLAQRLGRRFSGARGLTHIFPSAEVLSEANLRRVGLPPERAETICKFARAVCAGRIDFQCAGDSDSLLDKLRQVPGIGEWAVQYVAMRALREPDAFPNDVNLLRSMNLNSARELKKRWEIWRPWRAYAAMYLWKGVERLPHRNQHARTNGVRLGKRRMLSSQTMLRVATSDTARTTPQCD